MSPVSVAVLPVTEVNVTFFGSFTGHMNNLFGAYVERRPLFFKRGESKRKASCFSSGRVDESYRNGILVAITIFQVCYFVSYDSESLSCLLFEYY